MKAALVLCILSLFIPKSAPAQQVRAQMTASVTIVEAISVTAGATAVTQASGGTLDVTTPLSISGSAPRVVQVVDGERPRPIATQLCESRGPVEIVPCSIRSRLPAEPPRPADATRPVTYLVATIN
jgi:hypothetical protein